MKKISETITSCWLFFNEVARSTVLFAITSEVWLELILHTRCFGFCKCFYINFTLWFLNLFRHVSNIQMFNHTITYHDNWFNFVVSVLIFLIFVGSCTTACLWNVILLINLYMLSCKSILNVIFDSCLFFFFFLFFLGLV